MRFTYQCTVVPRKLGAGTAGGRRAKVVATPQVNDPNVTKVPSQMRRPRPDSSERSPGGGVALEKEARPGGRAKEQDHENLSKTRHFAVVWGERGDLRLGPVGLRRARRRGARG